MIMNNNHIPKYVTQARASFLLGLPMDEISRISRETGIGHMEQAGNEVETFFTYEELQKICVHATSEAVPTH
jgi:hypothetical protein